mmetsp:Transcript_11052/g.35012  ORF Transcript_11052/g.35012 Transcript_11052/m.35012 type:complete len:338 (-) Transcript_11052:18-1031(-)
MRLTQGMGEVSSEAEVVLGPVVEHENQGSAHAADHICKEAFVEPLRHALLCCNLLETVHGALVKMLLHRLLRLHLKASANSIKGVSRTGADRDGRLGCAKGGQGTNDALVVLVGVDAGNGVEGAKLQAAIADNADDRDAKARVEGQETSRARRRLGHAVSQAGERLLAGAHVGCQASSRVVKGIHNAKAASGRHPARDKVCTEELAKFRLGIVLREHLLEGILEGEVECLRGEVADAVCEVAIPEALHALLRVDADPAIDDALVARHFATPDLRVGILRLHDQLDAFDGRGESFCDCPREAAKSKVGQEGRNAILRHASEMMDLPVTLPESKSAKST